MVGGEADRRCDGGVDKERSRDNDGGLSESCEGEGEEERRGGGLVSDSRGGGRKRNVELIVRIERILDKIKI